MADVPIDYGTTDPQVWEDACLAAMRDFPEVAARRGFLASWFASTMEVGRRQRKATA